MEIQESPNYKKIAARIDAEWYPLHSQEWFTFEDIVRFFDWREQTTKHLVSQKLWYDSNKGKVLHKDNRRYRLLDKELDEINWWEGEENEGLPLKLPLDLQQYAKLYPPCLIVVAGLYNQGKTAFMLNIVNLNMETFPTSLFMSEGKELLRHRMNTLNPCMPKPPPFKAYRRLDKFKDVIVPDGLNVIDYLRVKSEQMYAVQDDLLAIYKKLGNKGIAVVALQKPPGRSLAYGGVFTAFDPALYISIDKGRMWFEKIKVPIPHEDLDLYKLKFEFKIGSGVNFYEIHEVIE